MWWDAALLCARGLPDRLDGCHCFLRQPVSVPRAAPWAMSLPRPRARRRHEADHVRKPAPSYGRRQEEKRPSRVLF